MLRAREDSIQIGSKMTSEDSKVLPKTLIYISCGWESFKEVHYPMLQGSMRLDYIQLNYPILFGMVWMLLYFFYNLIRDSYLNRIVRTCCQVMDGGWKKPTASIFSPAHRGSSFTPLIQYVFCLITVQLHEFV